MSKLQAILAKNASLKLASVPIKIRNKALAEIAKAIKKNKKIILNENKKDMEKATNLTDSLRKRLKLDNKKIREIIKEVNSVKKLEDPIGKTLSAIELDKNLELYQVTCPIGVIAAIFESRPDALVQIACLALKSANAVILKGGSEAYHSNRILAKIITKATKMLPKGWLQLIETREQVKELLKLDDYINLIIPRGSNKFVKYIMENTKIPVLGHAEGICHVYIDKEANLRKAVKISYDAKCQYAAVCNAMETLLVHKDIVKKFLPIIARKMKNVELRGDNETRKIININKATETDWKTEYNDLILSIKIVKNVDEAINHINKYGSHHTDAIVTKNKAIAKNFLSNVDSACVFWNCSTRFSDGYRFGKGAEVGISTSKIHARGPVGVEGLVIYKYYLLGKGHIVADYIDGKFTHKRLNKVWK